MILAFDTSASACSVAVSTPDGEVVALTSRDIGRGHAEALMPMIDETLSVADQTMKDITKLAVTTGPGSFTGVRVGVAAARGLALALDCPLLGMTALEALAFQYGCAGDLESGAQITSLIDARRGQAYAQTFEFLSSRERPRPVSEAAALSLDQAKAAFCAMEHVSGHLSLVKDGADNSHVDAGALARLARLVDSGGDVRPFYLRAPDATPSRGVK